MSTEWVRESLKMVPKEAVARAILPGASVDEATLRRILREELQSRSG